MSRKAAVNQEAVNKTCEQLQDENKAVTVNAVINIIGGSFSTVGEKVKLWKEEQTARTMPIIDMPETVTQAVQRAAADIWGAASALAGETVERIQNEAGEAITKAKIELSEYAGEVSRLENEIDQSHTKAVEADKQLSDTVAQVNSLNTVKATLESRITDRDNELKRLRSDLEKRQNDVGEAKAELSENKKEVSRLGNEVKQAHTKAVEADKQLSDTLAQVNSLNTVKATLESRITDKDSELKQAHTKAVEVDKQLSDTVIQVNSLNASNAALESRITDKDNEFQRLRSDFEKLQNELVLIAKANKTATKPSDKK